MKEQDGELTKSKICFLSNYPPKECGIATFTKDLASSMDRLFNQKLKSQIVALNEKGNFYNYDKKVIMQIDKEDVDDYAKIARKINSSKKIKLVCVQHEFGIFGGECGCYLIPFLDSLEKPVVVTFHSVLPNPDDTKKKVVQSIASRSSAIVVMAKRAIDILNMDYGIDKEKIHLIYHGIPNIFFQPNNKFKKKLKLDGKIILSTFGLLSRGKGIEYIIKALPKLIKKYPDLVYLVIGETHPMVREKEGELYRKKLIKLVGKLGLSKHVKFFNKYLKLQEIIGYLLASDIYICTNLDENQIVSGTLSYALGCGRAVISTPIAYAKEILLEERGLLVELKNPDSYSKQIDKILSDKELKSRLERNAYLFSRAMIWRSISARYLNIFNRVVKLRDEIVRKLPAIKLDHLRRMTDNFGIIQFSKGGFPDKSSGYTVDDNARALIATTLHYKLFQSKASAKLAKIYINFLEYCQRDDGSFINIVDENKKMFDDKSEDAFGRALWALGFSVFHDDFELEKKAKKIFDLSIKNAEKLRSPRAVAFSIIGLCYYYKKYKGVDVLEKINKLASFLASLYKQVADDNWQWFEDIISYSNPKLPKALFMAYDVTKNEEYLDIAKKTLKFLEGLVFVNGKLSPIGQRGWCRRNGDRAFFDQQAVDASSIIQTYLTVYEITKEVDYYEKAVVAFNWFLGRNHLGQMLYDESTSGCFDGLGEFAVNMNQGAESTISYLLARLSLARVKKPDFSSNP